MSRVEALVVFERPGRLPFVVFRGDAEQVLRDQVGREWDEAYDGWREGVLAGLLKRSGAAMAKGDADE